MDKTGFKYVRSGVNLKGGDKIVNSVTFNISRYGEFTETLHFDEPVTREEAVLKVEEWLSVPATWAYYEKIREDLLMDEETPESLQSEGILRGDLLTDCRFLEVATLKGGNLRLRCGS